MAKKRRKYIFCKEKAITVSKIAKAEDGSVQGDSATKFSSEVEEHFRKTKIQIFIAILYLAAAQVQMLLNTRGRLTFLTSIHTV